MNGEKKNVWFYELFDIYIYIYIWTLHIKEVDMNKKSNLSLICGGMKLKSKSLGLH